EEAEADMQAAANRLGVEMEDLQEVVPEVAGTFEQMAATIESSMPRVSEAVASAMSKAEEEGEELTLQSILDETERVVDDAESFLDNLETLLGEGFGEMAALAAQEGPAVAAALVDGLDDEQAARDLEDTLARQRELMDGELRDTAALFATEGTEIGEEGVQALLEALEEAPPGVRQVFQTDVVSEITGTDLADPARGVGERGMDGLITGIASKQEEVSVAASQVIGAAEAAADEATAGVGDIGADFVAGIASGMEFSTSLATIRAAAANSVNEAVQAAREAGGVFSPARVPAEKIGVPFSQGIAEGMLSAEGEVIAAAQRVVDDALRAGQDADPGLRLGAGTVPGGAAGTAVSAAGAAGVDIGSITVVAPEPRAAGRAVVTEITDQVYLTTGRATALAGAGAP
ncbi:MAG: hypothetical protein ACOC96_05630, partial [Actinomycetota bacterium]